MRGLILSSLFIAALAVGCGERRSGSSADETAGDTTTIRRPLDFAELVSDLGRIDEAKGVVSHKAIFENTTESPIVIVRVQTQCGCITADFPKEAVEPSAKGAITIKYNPAYRKGFFSESLDIIYVSEGRERHTRIWANGTVIPCKHPIEEDHPYDLGEGLHTNLKVLSAGKLAAGETKTIILNYANSKKRKVKILFEVEGDTADRLEMPRKTELKPDERSEMRITYTMPEGASGVQRLTVTPIVDGRPAQALEFTATAFLR